MILDFGFREKVKGLAVKRMRIRTAATGSVLLAMCLVFLGGKVVSGEVQSPSENTLCVVCHVDLKKEPISVVHDADDITCMKCHGPSTAHMQDEMLMTKPDLLFGRTEVVPMCMECHDDHEDPDAVDAFLEQWRGRHRENGRAITDDAVCTDCHGAHNIVTEMGEAAKASDAPKWTALFNGLDLTGWNAEGNATWTVERGSIVGRQGPNAAAGNLFSEQEFGDFELVVTFKMEWPGNSGVWFRYQSPEKAYQADILEYRDPVCYAGSLYCPGKMFLALNEDPDIVNRELWNTLIIRAQGDHLVVTLNDVVTADVHDASFDRGRVGFQIHPGDVFKAMAIHVREVLIRDLAATQGLAQRP